jgi:hypothetical protein
MGNSVRYEEIDVMTESDGMYESDLWTDNGDDVEYSDNGKNE